MTIERRLSKLESLAVSDGERCQHCGAALPPEPEVPETGDYVSDLSAYVVMLTAPCGKCEQQSVKAARLAQNLAKVYGRAA